MLLFRCASDDGTLAASRASVQTNVSMPIKLILDVTKARLLGGGGSGGEHEEQILRIQKASFEEQVVALQHQIHVLEQENDSLIAQKRVGMHV